MAAVQTSDKRKLQEALVEGERTRDSGNEEKRHKKLDTEIAPKKVITVRELYKLQDKLARARTETNRQSDQSSSSAGW